MEAVKEQERGVVNGVQNSMNEFMNMLKFALVTALPLAPQYGILVMFSITFVSSSALLQAVFVNRIPRDQFSRGTLG